MIGSDILLSIIGVECLENLKLSKLFILWIRKFYILNIELHLITKEHRFMGFLINMTSLGRFPKKGKETPKLRSIFVPEGGRPKKI